MISKGKYKVHIELGAEEFDIEMPLTEEQLAIVKHEYDVDTEELGFCNWETLSDYVTEYLQDNTLYFDLKDALREGSVFAIMKSFEPCKEYEVSEISRNEASC